MSYAQSIHCCGNLINEPSVSMRVLTKHRKAFDQSSLIFKKHTHKPWLRGYGFAVNNNMMFIAIQVSENQNRCEIQ